MGYATVTDMQARYPNRDLVQLTNEDPTQVTVNTAYLQTFLDDASDEIDGYLDARYSLPLVQVPRWLTAFACKIAMYNLQNLRPLHDLKYAETQYTQVIDQLTAVKNGALGLGLSASLLEADTPTDPAVVQLSVGGSGSGGCCGVLPTRIFSRCTLIGF